MKRILVIEDDPAVRGLILDTIRLKAWHPMEAADGEAGLRLAEEEQPDLILCDIQMPGVDGYAVLRRIRENKATAAIPFIFLSGLGEKPRVRQGMESGADDYITKPFTVQELTAAIDARFQKQAAFQKTAESRLNELRESLTFALPHELVTPLNTILGFSSLLLESPELSRSELKEYASLMHEAGERLKGLIEKFLVYAHVELSAGNPALRDAPHRAPHLTKETIAAAAVRVSREFKRPDDLRLSLAPIEHRISASHLERIIRELVENAFKFSDANSSVEVKSSTKDGQFIVEVTDRGRGLSTDQIQRLGANLQFDRRLHEQQGSGLGLAIARRLAELYDGAIHLESVPRERTAVTMQIPL
ncbi:MAG: hybrid sensor histidine kinase/response regulator [Limisphaerales bacterium]